jgi:hypothetical protein
MTDFVARSRAQYVEYIKRTNPALYRAVLARVPGRMGTLGEDAASGTSWYDRIFDGLTTIGSAVYESKQQKDAQKAELARITADNKAQAIAAQQQAIDAMQRQAYAAQVAALQQQQIEAERGQQDTVLMVGGFLLAALVGAKLLKVI